MRLLAVEILRCHLRVSFGRGENKRTCEVVRGNKTTASRGVGQGHAFRVRFVW